MAMMTAATKDLQERYGGAIELAGAVAPLKVDELQVMLTYLGLKWNLPPGAVSMRVGAAFYTSGKADGRPGGR